MPPIIARVAYAAAEKRAEGNRQREHKAVI